ncbi:type I 3-dehydroquinate dehydratase [Enterococcus malodoratus]|uniref:3-dehydroquinate dehydratase n=1 Tax=Enterococcus malodoratus ATCC 43197 TaxID=1158601 RepID=R2QUL3_9ENTE|nr:type I 3-dehydroquinate dehydratase [Enterococcus malodoratus]EOH72191.1 3-dehydroquinate dehydratase, type I [Enterococcus malodoratus ATCC 43197]EOT70484.1 3-dehydroquinate dehydratase, type I [Enterococcus malodoratus ATCC 43197]OJG64290.1 3-dehydroquinate dehydratase, type I [Enterococcus malodoratus]STD65694.1 3-dehydroquinate dehydratase [Enterococcus malodoratus]
MKTVTVDKTTIGEGMPKIIVPMVGQTKEELLMEAELIHTLDCDLVEWRIDFFEHVLDPQAVARLSYNLKAILEKPLLITFRTKKEGGVCVLSDNDYFNLYKVIISEGDLDLLDVELFMPSEKVAKTIELAHQNGIKVIMCNHDFDKTPEKNEIMTRLRSMQNSGADICKIAVMPQNSDDVLTLLEATQEMYNNYAEVPLITMSMGALGMISRVSGQVFGSAATFGAASKASAPGQVPVAELRKMINTLQV